MIYIIPFTNSSSRLGAIFVYPNKSKCLLTSSGSISIVEFTNLPVLYISTYKYYELFLSRLRYLRSEKQTNCCQG